MVRRRRAMTPEKASLKKIGGHINEHDFAELIGGEVNLGAHTDKKDVIDQQHRFHSVKGGKWWQIFLYSRNRLATNTIFQGLGDTAELMIRCLDAFPQEYEQHLSDKRQAKEKIMEPMRLLKEELKKEKLLPAFLDKALFNGGEAHYLSILPGSTDQELADKNFHVFSKNDVIRILVKDLIIRNSKARNAQQTDDQKVVLRSRVIGRNIGEIEVRADSPTHYREMKFRLNGSDVFSLLIKDGMQCEKPCPQVKSYGEAMRTFRVRQGT